MQDFDEDFEITPNQVWLNAASEGPLPTVSAKALTEAVYWKSSPERLTLAKFSETPLLLKNSIAKLIHVDAKDIILGNSATYGMHLLSNGLSLKASDQVLVMQNDFPTDILPWLHLKLNGVDIVQLKSEGPVLSVEEIIAAITPDTRVICLPMVHSFSGWALDIKSIGAICHAKGIFFIVNMSQVFGALPVDVSTLPVDAVVCAGYKWLLGPYGTGFCWIKPEWREQLHYPQSYWISLLDDHALNSDGDIALPVNTSSRKSDVFGTANFFNFVPWCTSIDYINNIGIDAIKSHNEILNLHMHENLDRNYFTILSPSIELGLTSIIVITHKNKANNKIIMEHLKANGVHLAFWKNTLRISVHLYNTKDDVTRLLTLLNAKGQSL